MLGAKMTCAPTDIPPKEEIDIPALRAKHLQERDKRLTKTGQAQYERLTSDLAADYEHDPFTPVTPRDPIHEDLEVAILGAGWTGVLAGYHLTKLGVTDFRHIDHAGDFGGVWYWNRYPGLQCDNDAYCYLPLLEETGYMPSKQFSDGYEIYDYFKLIANKFRLYDGALFHTMITGLRWDEGIRRWRVSTSRGDELRARFVIMAGGVLNMPKLPGIPGIHTFKGEMFHTARWDHGYTGGSWRNPVLDKLGDKRVAIVGTGATAVQAVPYLAKYAKRLYVLQRTPPNIDARHNPPTDPEWAKSLKPGWQAERMANFHRAAQEVLLPGEADLVCDIWTELNRNLNAELEAEGWPQPTPEEFTARRELMDYRVMERMRRRVDAIVNDKRTAEALKPWFRFMCKRPLSSNDYYPTFNLPNVKLIDVSATQGLEAMTENGFVADGIEYPIDCMIFASGFEVTSDLERRWGIPIVEGKGGQSIYDHWRDGPSTFHGVMTDKFPNMFYTGFVQGATNSTTTEQFGRQCEHIAYIVAEARRLGAEAVEPTKAAVEAYVAHMRSNEIDLASFLGECTPSYFNNEGEARPKWALFRGYLPGWDNFMKMLREWRENGELAGLVVSRARTPEAAQ
jgi:cyclohexanone monooxygenase